MCRPLSVPMGTSRPSILNNHDSGTEAGMSAVHRDHSWAIVRNCWLLLINRIRFTQHFTTPLYRYDIALNVTNCDHVQIFNQFLPSFRSNRHKIPVIIIIIRFLIDYCSKRFSKLNTSRCSLEMAARKTVI